MSVNTLPWSKLGSRECYGFAVTLVHNGNWDRLGSPLICSMPSQRDPKSVCVSACWYRWALEITGAKSKVPEGEKCSWAPPAPSLLATLWGDSIKTWPLSTTVYLPAQSKYCPLLPMQKAVPWGRQRGWFALHWSPIWWCGESFDLLSGVIRRSTWKWFSRTLWWIWGYPWSMMGREICTGVG